MFLNFQILLLALHLFTARGALGQEVVSAPTANNPKPFKIAFVRRALVVGEFARYHSNLYVIDSNGDDFKALKLEGTSPAWSPDGKLIAYCDDGNLQVANADGSSPHAITGESFKGACSPAWSPDGTRIAFDWLTKGKVGVYIANVDGSGANLVLPNASAPSWSPDGRRLVVQSARDGNLEIYTVGTNGENLTRLTNYRQEDSSPSWSHDGQRIAFSRAEGDRFSIFFMNADGSNVTRFVADKKGNLCTPVWSPDGNSIVFVREFTAPLHLIPFDSNASRCIGEPSMSQIMMMNLDGSKVRLLTSDRDISPSVAKASE